MKMFLVRGWWSRIVCKQSEWKMETERTMTVDFFEHDRDHIDELVDIKTRQAKRSRSWVSDERRGEGRCFKDGPEPLRF